MYQYNPDLVELWFDVENKRYTTGIRHNIDIE